THIMTTQAPSVGVLAGESRSAHVVSVAHGLPNAANGGAHVPPRHASGATHVVGAKPVSVTGMHAARSATVPTSTPPNVESCRTVSGMGEAGESHAGVARTEATTASPAVASNVMTPDVIADARRGSWNGVSQRAACDATHAAWSMPVQRHVVAASQTA